MYNIRFIFGIVIGIVIASFGVAQALSTFLTVQGGTGTTTPSGILYGDNGVTSALKTVTVGSNCTFVAGVLNCSDGGVGTSTNPFMATYFVATSTTATSTFNGNLFVGGSTVLTNPLAITSGGTGQTTANSAFNALSPMTNAGDIIYGGASGAATRLGIGGANTVLHGGASQPAYAAVTESDISLSNNSTNDATTGRHGFLPILSNVSTQFLNGQGNFATPSGTTNSYLSTAFSAQTSVNVVHSFGAYPVIQVIESSGEQMIPASTTQNTLNDFTVTFSQPTSGTIIASVGSPQPQSVIVVNSDYTVLTTDRIVEQTAMNKTLSLPTAVGNTGREFLLVNASSGNMTASTTVSGQTINGFGQQVVPAGSAMNIFSDGSNYKIY